ncbi:hypothetical protein BDZ89DRAFT_1062398 [Hymenopellis radicata]|nr:hypothetical protein BDZ89DRAFT_1062398 [Hymenopellis radicata]
MVFSTISQIHLTGYGAEASSAPRYRPHTRAAHGRAEAAFQTHGAQVRPHVRLRSFLPRVSPFLHGKEASVTQGYREYMAALADKNAVYHVEYDFHTETKG